ncbi:MAG TPA: hypothetical protein VIT19_12100 [Pyrinomonadaceae bacterium]
MNNDQLRDEADVLMQKCILPELLADYASWFIGGSYNYELMCWRDLDVYVLDPQHDLRKCFEIGYQMTHRLSATKSRFTNNVGADPNGLYWGIKLGDARQGAWKLDLWFLDAAGYEKHSKYCDNLRLRLTAETRSAILEIKSAYWRRREYRDTITSHLIYRAVLDHDVRTVHDFERWLDIIAKSE